MPPRKKAKTTATRKSSRLGIPASAHKNTGRATATSQTAAPPATAPGSADKSIPSKAGEVGSLGAAELATLHARREGLLNLPLDVLIEILILLHPRDLLNLVRTSKDFCTYLSSRRSAPCWRAARQRIEDLPECPPDLSEPYYARLVFTKDCMACGEPAYYLLTNIWCFRTQLCLPCSKDKFVREQDARALLDEVAKTTQRTDKILPSHPDVLMDMHRAGSFFWKQDIQALRNKWATLEGGAEKTQAAEEQMGATAQRIKFANDMQKYQRAEDSCLRVRYDIYRDQRLDQICGKLTDEGWAEDLRAMERTRYLWALETHERVRAAWPLTDNEWQDIRWEMIEFMESLRAARLKLEWQGILRQRLALISDVVFAHDAEQGRRTANSNTQAEVVDLALHPAFRKVIHAPVSISLTRADVEQLLKSRIPALRSEWRDSRARDFRKLLDTVSGGDDTTETDVLTLAVATFRCTTCKRADIRWPAVLAHSCARVGECSNGTYEKTFFTACEERGLPLLWKQTFTVNPHWRRQWAVILACGLDPRKATLHDVEACAARLYCMGCATPEIGFLEAFDWKGAASHQKPRCDKFISKAGNGKWKALKAKHAAKVLHLEAALRTRASSQQSPDAYGCAHCCFRSRTPPVAHCLDEHDIVAPKVDVDYYVHLDATHHSGQAPNVGPILIYPEYARNDRIAAKDVKQGRAFFSSSLFQS